MTEALELAAMSDFLSTFDTTSLGPPVNLLAGEVCFFGAELCAYWTIEERQQGAFGSDDEPLANTDTEDDHKEGQLGIPAASSEISLAECFLGDSTEKKRLRQRDYDKKARCKKKRQEENDRNIFIHMINLACLELEAKIETTCRARFMLATVHADMCGLQLAMQAQVFPDSTSIWDEVLRKQERSLKSHLHILNQQLMSNRALVNCAEVTIVEWSKARSRNKYFLRKKAPKITPGMRRLATALQELTEVDTACRAWVDHLALQ